MAVLRSLMLGLTLALAACASARTATPAAAGATEAREPVTILVSIDGLRPDYLDRGFTPNLTALAAEGVRAQMRPAFPTKTFPNHQTLMTGLGPDTHGVVDNNMEDPRKPGIVFKTSNSEVSKPFWWDAAEPLWISAEKQGIRTGIVMWPGVGAPWGDLRPTAWMGYEEHITSRQRTDTILDWVRRPRSNRPRFLAVYFDALDTAGHDYGPDSRETRAAMAALDAEIGYLRRELAAMGQPANLIVLSDHGMAATALERVIRIDRLIDAAALHVVTDGPFMALAPTPGREQEVERKLLGRHPHFECWRKSELPARFRYGRNPRVQPLFCLADHGWVLFARSPPKDFDIGNHGFDNEDPEMRAPFIAAGPGIARAGSLPLFDNVDVYPFLAALAGVKPLAHAGSAATLRPALRRRNGEPR